RAISTLKAVDVIAAEDTRHSKSLLQHLNIQTRLLSYHQHNESMRGEELLEALLSGSDIALISDAGTPLISDPGYSLVNLAVRAGISVVPIPGVSSVIAALSAASLSTESFYFSGFLSAKSQERLNQLQRLLEMKTTLVLFESSHRIEALLIQMEQVFADRACVIAKELSKIYERFLRGTPGQILEALQQDPALKKGEFVVLIDNMARPREKEISSEDQVMLKTLLQHLSVKQASKIAAELSGKKKNEIYQLALQMKKQEEA
ncbi:MAG: 16S rRNA (cytidine(1402)-2'-O)-methyltransferase, partial [Pseudomonadota bacterium]